MSGGVEHMQHFVEGYIEGEGVGGPGIQEMFLPEEEPEDDRQRHNKVVGKIQPIPTTMEIQVPVGFGVLGSLA